MYGSIQRALALATGVALASLPTVASAFRAPDYAVGRPAFEVASGPAVRAGRDVRWNAPADLAGAEAIRRFKQMHGQAWRVLYDDNTNVPLRIYGQGIPVPGSVANPVIAENAARALLGEQINLLAPGARPSEFALTVNDHQPTRNMRSLKFQQKREGLDVLGGAVTFTFKNDRLFVIGSTAIPNLTAHAQPRSVSDAKATAFATDWVRSDVATTTSLRSIEGPFMLPLVHTDGSVLAHTVVRVTLDAEPIGRWAVYVDSVTGQPVAREQKLMFATATVNFDVPNRYPQNGRINKPARGAQVGTGLTVAADGKINFTGTTANLTIKCVSTFVKVLNSGGSALSAAATVMDGGTLNFSRATNEFDDAQLQTFVSMGIVKARMKKMRPQLTWLDQSINATVNINDVCNAFSDGTNVNFFRKGGSGGLNCENTGRLLDVTMHEVGHSFHNHVITTGDFDGALSEGISDYFAVDITEDPGMGKGFFADAPEDAMRDCDTIPEATWPSNAEIHTKGIIIAGALWDARKNFKAALGDAGVDSLNESFADALARAVDIPTMYTEILASDDDDGNLANGTPNKCLIDDAFARHNLTDGDADVGPSVSTPVLNGLHLTVPVSGGSSACPGKEVTGAKLDWKVRGSDGMNGSANLAQTAAGWEVDLPSPGDSLVLNYKVTVTFGDNTTATFPDNKADPFYETYLGETEEIYCTNFESDPYAAGWTHTLVTGTPGAGADDWMWGVPTGEAGSGDPGEAFGGTKAIGNDLGGMIGPDTYNGQYQASKVNQTVSPVIDLEGHTANVRLQYRRWLNVEDGSKDEGEILVDGNQRWVNTAAGNEHTDREWRFHDVDLSADAADGKVQVTFKLTSDASGNRGGWTVDDFCIVATSATTPVDPICGNGKTEAGEECDDGNTASGDGCSALCQTELPPGVVCGDGTKEEGEECDDGNTTGGDGCSATCRDENTSEPVCGNGAVEGNEQCDDGNADDTDSCKSDCTTNGTNPGDGDGDGGCGCQVGARGTTGAGAGAGFALLGLAGAALFVRRRRRG